MVPSLQASSQARDITIELNNSCNCCCFDRFRNRKNPQTKMYVNSLGVAEKYDPEKAVDPQAALKRAIENLNRVIDYNASLSQKYIEVIHIKIVDESGSRCDEVDFNPDSGDFLKISNTESWPITINLIEKLNTVMKQFF